MGFAKLVLILAILIAIGLAVFLRVRAWRLRRAEAKRAWDAEVRRAIEGD